MPRRIDFEENGTQRLMTAIIQQAIKDYATGDTDPRYYNAGAFLEDIGGVDDYRAVVQAWAGNARAVPQAIFKAPAR